MASRARTLRSAKIGLYIVKQILRVGMQIIDRGHAERSKKISIRISA
jgi:hypothetical protein